MTVYIGIDPAQLVSGFAFEAGAVRAAATCGDILKAEEFLNGLELEIPAGALVVLTVEYPTFNVGGSPVVRAAANTWIRAVKERAKAAGAKVQVNRVHPSTWRARMIRGRACDTKLVAMPTARAYKFHPDSVDAAEAALILVYGRDWLGLMNQTQKPKRKNKFTK